jgi:hypothetical protein
VRDITLDGTGEAGVGSGNRQRCDVDLASADVQTRTTRAWEASNDDVEKATEACLNGAAWRRTGTEVVWTSSNSSKDGAAARWRRE